MERNRVYLLALFLMAVFTSAAFGAAVWYCNEAAQLRRLLAETDTGDVAAVASEAPVASLSVPSANGGETQYEIAALNAYIDKLEAANQALKEQLQSAGNGGDGNRRRRDRVGRLEELKEKDPEAYERITRRMEEQKQRMEEREQRRREYIASLDTSMLSTQQNTMLKAYQELLEEGVRLRQGDGGTSPEDMRDYWRRMSQMRPAVQDILFEQLSSQLGTDRETLVEGVQQIMEATGPGGFGGPPPPPRER